MTSPLGAGDGRRGVREWLREHPRIRTHLPFGVVCLVAVVGFLRIGLQHWREGAALLGVALLIAAVLRVVVPEERIGLLGLRSRAVDIVLYTVLGAVIGYVAMTIEGGPFSG